ncbi:MAG: hypothetical protein L0I88_02985, partial [Alkalibacterium sp.]|nr:hypothetical protein [Alkalibacterium sp.]
MQFEALNYLPNLNRRKNHTIWLGGLFSCVHTWVGYQNHFGIQYFVPFTENMKIDVILRYAEELQLVIHQQNMPWIFKLTCVREIEEKYFWLIFVWNSRAIFYLS